jgi:MATE family multidrug resistance protein
MSLTLPDAARSGVLPAAWRLGIRLWPSTRREAGAIVRLAGPIVLIALVNMGMSVTDTMMVSWFFGTEALAAVAVGSDFYSIVFYLGTGVIAGVSPFFARAIAEKSGAAQEKYRRIGWRVTIATAIGLFPLVWLAPDMLAHAGLDRGILESGRGYTRAMALTLVPMLVVVLFRTLLTAAERPKVFLRVTLIALPLNAVANGAFMNGFAGIPAFGPTGAGVASFLVATVMAILLAVVFRSEIRAGRRSVAARATTDWKAVAEVVRVGIPIGIATVAELGIYLGATLYAATLSAADVAAHTITLRLAGVVYAIPLALMQASTVRIARRDATDGQGLREVIATAMTIAVFAGIGLTVLLVALAPGVAALTFDHTELGITAAGLTIGLIALLAAIELLETPGSAASGLLRGLKDTRMPMAYVLVGYWLIGVPLGVYLSKGLAMGITGVWIALVVGSLVVSGLTLLRLRRHWLVDRE